ncbi:MAG: mechanosensitive ion channel [Proteobacteria bacterium]|nr:mechanosensitive ion channel [Pseudomonadota bacterium]
MFAKLLALLLFVPLIGVADTRQILEPIDTDSPRATVGSFVRLTEEVGRNYSAYRDSPSPDTQQALMQAAVKTTALFDLSQIPEASRQEAGIETFLQLWEVVARLDLPNLGDIPDRSAYDKDGEKPKGPTQWLIPGTDIAIARVGEGAHAGEFLFSAKTVERAANYYGLVRGLPYKRPVPTKNLYLVAQTMTGWMIPLAWTESLPDWANTPIAGQVAWKWLATLLSIGLAALLGVFVFRWSRVRSKDSTLRSHLRQICTPLFIIGIGLLLKLSLRNQVNITGFGSDSFNYLLEILYGMALVWIVWLTANWIADAIIHSPKINPESLDAHLIRLAARFVGIIAALTLIFRVANQVGVPVYGLVAGAGVGGLAVALAAKSTLENFMGALNLFADRPVRIGDLCRYDDDSSGGWRSVGKVESIGLRSTKIRRHDRSLITIPNAEFSQKHIVNLSVCDRMLFHTTLGMRYETTDDQLRFLLADLRELLHGHPKTVHTAADPIRVRFVGFGDFSLNVDIRAYVRTSDYNEFLAVQEDILLRVMQVVKKAGTGFAFPSSTLYHARDGGLDSERQQDAEKQVREWSLAQKLPFPDFAEEYRLQITDTLDYPPEGSPSAGG